MEKLDGEMILESEYPVGGREEKRVAGGAERRRVAQTVSLAGEKTQAQAFVAGCIGSLEIFGPAPKQIERPKKKGRDKNNPWGIQVLSPILAD
jgi:hypothetical protein